jgi:CheY-like chemotaxis protein
VEEARTPTAASVLLVDDQPDQFARSSPDNSRWPAMRAEPAEDGEQGLARWRSGRFALVLSDVHMPKMDGYQLAACHPRGGGAPSIAHGRRSSRSPPRH